MPGLAWDCLIAAVALIIIVCCGKPIYAKGGYLQPKKPANPVPPSKRRGGETHEQRDPA